MARTLTCLALVLAPLPTLAAPSETDVARVAFDEGKQAFRLGKFESAAAAFERAYELSDLPDILYNIGLAHLRWYDIDPDVVHLRTAKAILQNYILEIEKNPELGDIEEVEQLIDETDAKIAAAEAKDTTPTTAPVSDAAPVDPSPGRGLHLGGSVAMGLGVALVIAGVANGVAFGTRGEAAQDDLTAAYADRDAMSCTPTTSSDTCTGIFDRIDTLRAEGRRANALAYGLGMSLGALGLVAVTVGAVLFVKGKKKARAKDRGRVSVAPTGLGGDGGGLVVTGRF